LGVVRSGPEKNRFTISFSKRNFYTWQRDAPRVKVEHRHFEGQEKSASDSPQIAQNDIGDI